MCTKRIASQGQSSDVSGRVCLWFAKSFSTIISLTFLIRPKLGMLANGMINEHRKKRAFSIFYTNCFFTIIPCPLTCSNTFVIGTRVFFIFRNASTPPLYATMILLYFPYFVPSALDAIANNHESLTPSQTDIYFVNVR